jgi:hypothetical protein
MKYDVYYRQDPMLVTDDAVEALRATTGGPRGSYLTTDGQGPRHEAWPATRPGIINRCQASAISAQIGPRTVGCVYRKHRGGTYQVIAMELGAHVLESWMRWCVTEVALDGDYPGSASVHCNVWDDRYTRVSEGSLVLPLSPVGAS